MKAFSRKRKDRRNKSESVCFYLCRGVVTQTGCEIPAVILRSIRALMIDARAIRQALGSGQLPVR